MSPDWSDKRDQSAQEPTSSIPGSELSNHSHSSTSNSLSTGEESSSSYTNLPLSPPPHILRRLTPLKKKDQVKSPETNASPKKKIVKKSRTLSATEVLDKVSQLKLSNQLKNEQKKFELQRKSEAAMKNREKIILKKKENATKFLMNTEIWGSFQETFPDFELNSDREERLSDNVFLEDTEMEQQTIFENTTGAIAEQPTTKHDLPFSHLDEATLKAANTIRRAIIKNLYQGHVDFIKSFDIFSKTRLQDVFRNHYQGPVKKFYEEVLLNETLLHSVHVVSNALGVRDEGTIKVHKLVLVAIRFLYDYTFRFNKLPKFGKEGLENRLISLPKLKRNLHYYEKLSGYLTLRMVARSHLLLKSFKDVIYLKKLPSGIDIERLRFFKCLSSFQEMYYLFNDDEHERLILQSFLVNDTLKSALAIQEHIHKNRVFPHSVLELDAEVNSLTKFLKKQKNTNLRRVCSLKTLRKSYELLYNSPESHHFTRGITLKDRRKALINRVAKIEEEKSNNRKKSAILVPPGFTLEQWRRYILLLQYEKIDEVLDYRNKNGVPSSIRSGRPLTEYLKNENYLKKHKHEVIYPIETIQESLGILTHKQLADQLRDLIDNSDVTSSFQNLLKKIMKMTQYQLTWSKELSDDKVDSSILNRMNFIENYDFTNIQRIQDAKVERFFRYMIDLFNVFLSKPKYMRWAELYEQPARELKNIVDFENTNSYVSRFKEYIKFWELLMTVSAQIWVEESIITMWVKGYISYEIDLFEFSVNSKSTNKDPIKNELTTMRLKIFGTNIHSHNFFDLPMNQQDDQNQGNHCDFRETVVRFVMTKIFEAVKKDIFNEKFKLNFPQCYDTCEPDLINFIKKYQKILQVMFINYIIENYLHNAPLMFTGNETSNVLKNAYLTRTILKPNMKKFGTDLYCELFESRNPAKEKFKFDQHVIDGILEILVRHSFDKVKEDPRFTNLYIECEDPDYELLKFVTKNTFESSLKQLLQASKYFDNIAKSFNGVIYQCLLNNFVNYADDTERSTIIQYSEVLKLNSSLIKTKFSGIEDKYSEGLVYELIKLLSVHLTVYESIYKEALEGCFI